MPALDPSRLRLTVLVVFALALAPACDEPAEPPSIPQNLVATAKDRVVTLTWDRAERATGYAVLRATKSGGPFKVVVRTTQTRAEDAGDSGEGLAGGTHYYVVQAVSAAFGDSEASGEVAVTIESLAPAAPTGLTATGGKEVLLQWAPVTGADSYLIHRSDKPGSVFEVFKAVTETHHTDTEVEPGATYFYAVKSHSAEGDSEPSTEVNALTIPAAPTLQADGQNRRVLLSWAKCPGAVSYRLVRSAPPDGGTTQFVVTPDASDTSSHASYTDQPLPNGQEFSYVVHAVNSSGESEASNQVQAKPVSGQEVCVLDTAGPSVALFDAQQAGDLPPLRRFGGLTGLSAPASVRIDPLAKEIYVSNSPAGAPELSSVRVFALDATGNAAPGRVLPLLRQGAVASGLSPFALEIDPEAGELFVADFAANQIDVYSAKFDTQVPLRSLKGPLTGLDQPRALALDKMNNRLFVANADSITVYSKGASDDVAPIATIAASTPGLSEPSALAIDEAGKELWVADPEARALLVYVVGGTAEAPTFTLDRTLDQGTLHLDRPSAIALVEHLAGGDEVLVANYDGSSVTVYHRNALPDDSPVRTLYGSATGIAAPLGLALDASDPAAPRIVLSASAENRLSVFPLNASGNVAPARTISGEASGLSNPRGIATDLQNKEVVIANQRQEGFSLAVYALTAAEAGAAPLRVLESSSVLYVRAVAVSPKDWALWAAGTDGAGGRVVAFAHDATGPAAPRNTIGGEDSRLQEPSAVAVRLVGDQEEVFVANRSAHSVTVYRVADAGSSPVREIAGAATSLDNPVALALDGTELFVANAAGKVTVYAASAEGDVAPLRVLSGPKTLLTAPTGIALNPNSDEIFVADDGRVLVFARAAEGDVDFLRTIGPGPLSTLSAVSGVTVCK
ncbi:MAG: hypothetical protein HY901_20310 [Deltaproteobacteria bacterium]|nr:hypothetical protein [Deltaproteobacteria bacterium]